MEVEIEKETSDRIIEVSKELGIEKNKLVERAVLLYLDSMSKYVEFKKEMDDWDVLSDQAFENFEKGL